MEEFVRSAFRVVLRRDPEPEALAWASAALESGSLSRAALVSDLVGTDEFARLRALEDAVAFAARARAGRIRPRELTAPAWSDERLIEIPWVLARYRGERRVLDVGYANASRAYLEALAAAVPGEIVGVDLVEARVEGMRSVVGDVRSLPFADGSFDVVFCVSTIEHVGRNNRVYGARDEYDETGISAALRELRRVGLRILLTVPTGAEEDQGWFVQFPVATWRRLFTLAGLEIAEEEVYELDRSGWSNVSGEAEGASYGARGAAASAVYCVELRASSNAALTDSAGTGSSGSGSRGGGDPAVQAPWSG